VTFSRIYQWKRLRKTKETIYLQIKDKYQYFVACTFIFKIVANLRGMESTKLRHISLGILYHIFWICFQSSSACTGPRVIILFFMMCHKFSIGLASIGPSIRIPVDLETSPFHSFFFAALQWWKAWKLADDYVSRIFLKFCLRYRVLYVCFFQRWRYCVFLWVTWLCFAGTFDELRAWNASIISVVVRFAFCPHTSLQCYTFV